MALVLALALMVLWARSQLVADLIVNNFSDYTLATMSGSLFWVKQQSDYEEEWAKGLDMRCFDTREEGWTWIAARTGSHVFEATDQYEFTSRIRVLGSEFSVAFWRDTRTVNTKVHTLSLWKVPLFWGIVPLTAASGYLLLWKPQK